MTHRSFFAALCACVFSLACGAPEAPPPSADAIAAAESGEVRGYVFSDWKFSIPHDDPGECPEGFNITELEYHRMDEEELKRLYKKGGRKLANTFLPPDSCGDPTTHEDPGFLTLDGEASVAGMDLDGVDSGVESRGACAHADFVGPGGEQGIDNQFWRLVGCTKGFRPDNLIDRLFGTGNLVKEGGHAVLLELRSEDGLSARIFSGNDPVTLDSTGGAMRDASLQVHEDARYHSAAVPAQLEDEVLTTEPVDLRFRVKFQTMDNDIYFRDARIHAELQPDGSLRGIIAGYWDNENFFSVWTEQYIGPIRVARGAAGALGYMCSGLFHALPRVADGHPDPKTGTCTSISTTIEFEAVPAFVIQPARVAQAQPAR